MNKRLLELARVSPEGMQLPEVCNCLGTGAEWIVDASGCDSELLAVERVIQAFCEVIIGELQLKVVGTPQWHQFPGPGGVTGMYLLSESHLTCHTFPEYGLLTLNLYCCRPREEWGWERELRRRFSATDVRILRVARGIQPVDPVHEQTGAEQGGDS
ncbi:MAG: S-adenosylmethionine decarboxylase [Planctomycetaceae bacterium]|nr:S-adenosylmethionine decarboxylase [Planctomycetaceae bacterium]